MTNVEKLHADHAGTRRAQRALRALVANYLHELSERHGSPRARPGSVATAGRAKK